MRRPIRRIGNLVFDIDWLLILVSIGALSRAILYAFPLDAAPDAPFNGIYALLPPSLTTVYGTIWGIVAIFGFWAAIALRALFAARIFIFSMFAAWTVLYIGAVLFASEAGNRTFWTSSMLFFVLAGVSMYRVPLPKNRAIYVVLTPGYLRSLEMRRDKLSVEQLIKELHRYSTTPEDIISALSPSGADENQ